MSQTFTYLFEAASVQRFIMSSNRLSDLIGGSELIEQLCQKDLDDCINTLDIPDIRYSRRAGGSFCAFSNNRQKLHLLATIWPLVVHQKAPGLDWKAGFGEGSNEKEAFNKARDAATASRSFRLDRLPLHGPLAERDRQTGEVAVGISRQPDSKRPVDAATLRKIALKDGRALQDRMLGKNAGQYELPTRLSRDEDTRENGRDFPYKTSENEYINRLALVHADGNGLGQILRGLNGALADQSGENWRKAQKQFSDTLGEATCEAARKAVKGLIDSHRLIPGDPLPLRPIVLGGDDLTLLIRADLALDFTKDFMAHLESITEEVLGKLWHSLGIAHDKIPEKLTACAGIVYIKPKYPFHMAHELVEALCKQAKTVSKSLDQTMPPASLAFRRITNSLALATHMNKERTFQRGTYFTGMGAWLLKPGDPDSPWLDIDTLEVLSGQLADDNVSNNLRNILGLVQRDPDEAKTRYSRWLKQLPRTNPHLKQAIDRLSPDTDLPFIPEYNLPFTSECKKQRQSPLADALEHNAAISP